MVGYTYKELFNQDSVDKQLTIAYEGSEITNEDLYSESFELTESICSQNELRFGSCEASVIKFKIANTVDSLMNKWLTVSQVLAGKDDTPFRYGKYKVYSDVPSGDRNYRNITAYDAMYDIINAEMVTWYDGLAFPITMRDFRDSFFAYIGVEQEEIELIQDDMTIEKTIDADSISGKQIITAICELNGVFGHINRQGLFDYVSLAKRKSLIYPNSDIFPGTNIYPGMEISVDEENFYPSQELYPSDDLFPISSQLDGLSAHEILQNKYISCEYEDFETKIISKVQIRQEENDIGAIYGSGTNTYIVQDNFLVYEKSSSDLNQIARKLFAKINGVYYRPFKATLQGNPCIEVGDVVIVHTRYKEVESYVLERTIKGIQALRDTFESKGVYEYEEKINSVHKEIKQLKGKTNKLERTVEKTVLSIKDIEAGVQSAIKQLADSVAVSIDENGNIITSLTLDRNGMTFVGDKAVFQFKNFSLDENGNVYVNGRYESTTPDGVKSIEINNNMVRFYSWAENGEEVGRVGSLHNAHTGKNFLGITCEQGDSLTFGYFSGNEITQVISFDSSEPNKTPYIANTASGTLFEHNPNGGVKVEHGLIKEWNMFTILNHTLPVISGITWNSTGIKSLTITHLEIRDGLICDSRTETINY